MYHGEAPNDIEMEFYTHDRLGVRVKVPLFNNTAQRSISTAYENSFATKAARLWNILPRNGNTQLTLSSFKTALGYFMDKFPDTPPITGYTPSNSNSLIAWSCVTGVTGGRI